MARAFVIVRMSEDRLHEPEKFYQLLQQLMACVPDCGTVEIPGNAVAEGIGFFYVWPVDSVPDKDSLLWAMRTAVVFRQYKLDALPDTHDAHLTEPFTDLLNLPYPS